MKDKNKEKERERLCKKFKITSYSGGSYAEGLFDGLSIAEKVLEAKR